MSDHLGLTFDRIIEEAMTDLDAILETFAVMLRIAQIEGGARRAGFRPVNLTALARDVVDSFAPRPKTPAIA